MSYEVFFSKLAQDEAKELVRNRPALQHRIDRIVLELQEHPETGIGKPERLKGNWSGYMSRRIDDANRMIYRIDNSQVIVFVVHSKGHYDDK